MDNLVQYNVLYVYHTDVEHQFKEGQNKEKKSFIWKYLCEFLTDVIHVLYKCQTLTRIG